MPRTAWPLGLSREWWFRLNSHKPVVAPALIAGVLNCFHTFTPKKNCSDLVPFTIYNQDWKLFVRNSNVFNMQRKSNLHKIELHRLTFEYTLQKIVTCLKYEQNNKIKRLTSRSLLMYFSSMTLLFLFLVYEFFKTWNYVADTREINNSISCH